DRGVTIVLVTHFMEEAERLCDRVALIDAGKVVAIDTPAGLAGRVEAGQRIQFRAPGAGPLSQRELEVLELVAAGAANREAAARLFISEATVKSHLMNIYAKL